MKCMAYETLSTPAADRLTRATCQNEARHGSMFCNDHQLTPEVAAEMERRFGRLRICRGCQEGFRTKDPKQYQCSGCRRWG